MMMMMMIIIIKYNFNVFCNLHNLNKNDFEMFQVSTSSWREMQQRKVENNKGRNSEGGNGVYELSETE